MALDTAPATPAGQAPAQRPSPTSRLRLLGTGDGVITLVLVAFLLVASFTVEGFASSRNTGFLLLDVVVIVLIALPLTLVIITGTSALRSIRLPPRRGRPSTPTPRG